MTSRRRQFEEATRAALESSEVVDDIAEATEWVVNTLDDWGLLAEPKPTPVKRTRGGLLERSWSRREKQIVLNLHHGNGLVDSHPATLNHLAKMGVVNLEYPIGLTLKGKAVATYLEG